MMSGGGIGATRGDFLRLFDGGSAAGLGDGELLARFVGRRDEAAFEALVARHGPMILGVCRRMLADPRDAEDAFQATFLVLVRRAGSIRDREVLASWLHGVAVRVARKARLDAGRRADRERLGAVAEARDDSAPGLDWSEVRAGIDEEIGRLPESHRRLVVLCDVEGLSREEAAARLGWTANMVRGRLERARGRLRDRLTRRGLSPSGAYLALAMPATPPGAALVATTIRGALALLIGRSPGLGPAVALSEGVSRMMMLAKWKLGATAVVSVGAMLMGSGMLAARQGPGDGPPAAGATADPPARPRPAPIGPEVPGATEPPTPTGLVLVGDQYRPRPAAELRKARVDAARARYDAQAAFYREGRLTVDRVVDASRVLMETEVSPPSPKAARVAAARAHHARLDALLKKEQAELEVGRATAADVNEIESALLEAEFALAKEIEAPGPPAAVDPAIGVEAGRKSRRKSAEEASKPDDAPVKALAKARAALARELLDNDHRLFAAGEIPIDSVVASSKVAMEAARDAAETREGRAIADAEYVKFLTGVVAITKDLAGRGERTQSDLKRARLALLEAEILQAGDAEAPALPAPPEAGAEAPGAGLPGAGVVPSPAGKSPATRPAGPAAGIPARSLAAAVAAFNRLASQTPGGDSEPTMTEDEVIAAIKSWRRDRETTVIRDGAFTNLTPPDAPIGEFKAIAETRQLPPGSALALSTERDAGEDFLYEGWFVVLSVASEDGPIHDFPIRSRLTRLISLDEARKRLETETGPAAPSKGATRPILARPKKLAR